jgi:hypothetical protein
MRKALNAPESTKFQDKRPILWEEPQDKDEARASLRVLSCGRESPHSPIGYLHLSTAKALPNHTPAAEPIPPAVEKHEVESAYTNYPMRWPPTSAPAEEKDPCRVGLRKSYPEKPENSE